MYRSSGKLTSHYLCPKNIPSNAWNSWHIHIHCTVEHLLHPVCSKSTVMGWDNFTCWWSQNKKKDCLLVFDLIHWWIRIKIDNIYIDSFPMSVKYIKLHLESWNKSGYSVIVEVWNYNEIERDNCIGFMPNLMSITGSRFHSIDYNIRQKFWLLSYHLTMMYVLLKALEFMYHGDWICCSFIKALKNLVKIQISIGEWWWNQSAWLMTTWPTTCNFLLAFISNNRGFLRLVSLLLLFPIWNVWLYNTFVIAS